MRTPLECRPHHAAARGIHQLAEFTQGFGGGEACGPAAGIEADEVRPLLARRGRVSQAGRAADGRSRLGWLEREIDELDTLVVGGVVVGCKGVAGGPVGGGVEVGAASRNTAAPGCVLRPV